MSENNTKKVKPLKTYGFCVVVQASGAVIAQDIEDILWEKLKTFHDSKGNEFVDNIDVTKINFQEKEKDE